MYHSFTARDKNFIDFHIYVSMLILCAPHVSGLVVLGVMKVSFW